MGNMGVVFRAWDYTLRQDVALKVPKGESELDPTAVARFRIEVKALSTLNHKNISKIIDYDLETPYPYLVTPLIEGGDLDEWLQAHRPAPIDAVCGLIRTIALAMEHAHRHNIIHRDLKLSNVMLDANGAPIVTDFGLALLLDYSLLNQITAPGRAVGTVLYMSPEQLQGRREKIGRATDIYALGIMMFKLLTKRFPFTSTDSTLIKQEIISGITVAPSTMRSDVGKELDQVFFRTVTRRSDKRFRTMEELAERLSSYLGLNQLGSSMKIDQTTVDMPASLPITVSPLGVAMATIPAGSFQMGGIEGRPEEAPMRDVAITRPFLLGIFPVTQGQYKALMGDSPKPECKGPDTLPMECVTWLNAISFCNVLSIKERLRPYYKIDGDRVTCLGGTGYRLPTEAEWEYACRAGSTTRYFFGEDDGALSQNAWFDENSEGKTHAVGLWPPNAFSLHDVHGNVWEWCWDWFGAYDVNSVVNPKGPDTGSKRVLRGGSWHDTPFMLRSAARTCFEPNDPEFRAWYFGFRVARDV